MIDIIKPIHSHVLNILASILHKYIKLVIENSYILVLLKNGKMLFDITKTEDILKIDLNDYDVYNIFKIN